MSTETPLIYTTEGNLPIADLEYATRWEVEPDYIKLVETYTRAGVIVRESAHVLHRSGLAAGAETAQLN